MVVGIMSNYIKKNRYKIMAIFLILFVFYVVRILPMNEALTPQISTMEGELYGGIEETLEVQTELVFWGDNLDDVDTIYIDGKKNEQCQIVNISENRIVIDIPSDIYMDKEGFYIQVAKKIGGIWEYKGKRFQVSIKQYEEDIPVLTKCSIDSIEIGEEQKKVILSAENLVEGSKLYINGVEVNAEFDYATNKIGIYVNPNMCVDRDSVEFKLGIDLNGLGQKLWSEAIEIPITQVDYKKYEHSYDFAEQSQLIMHAAGEWNGYTYTNCLEAFMYNYERGCKTFEIDLIETSDEVIVGRHDWTTVMYEKSLVSEEDLVLETSQRNNLPKTYDELCNMYSNRTPLTWHVLLEYLSTDEELYIVTDTKDYTDKAIEKLFSKMIEIAKEENKEDVLDRVVVQVYNQEMYRQVMSIYPFESVIYTLYQSPDSNQEVLDFIDNSNVRMITLPKNTIRDDDVFFQELLDRGCYIYVHTINDISIAANYYERGCTGIYTDIIRPEHIASIEEEIYKIKLDKQDQSTEIDIQANLEEVQNNKEYLLNYLNEIDNEDYLVILSVQDEATAMVDDDIAEALSALGVSDDYKDHFRSSYVGIMSNGSVLYEEFSDELIECIYIDDQNIFKIKSAGNGIQESSSISVNGIEKITDYNRGLHIVVFNKEKGIVQDTVVFDLYDDLGHTFY